MKILCFGEPLIRFATTGYERLEDAHQMEITYGGNEAVTAASLASQGEDVVFASKISENRLGTNALMMLARCGVDTSRVIRSAERMGLYYSEKGKSIRPSIVTYDRSGTAMALAKHSDFNWDSMLNGVSLFYFSGITAAISNEMFAACKEGLAACQGRGIYVVCDLNYRNSMWEPEYARTKMKELFPYINELIASEDDLTSINQASVSHKKIFNYCLEKFQELMSEYSFHRSCFIVRQNNKFDFGTFQGALLTSEGNIFVSKVHHATVTDLSSTGTIFAASAIHAERQKWNPQFCIDYATISSAYKATVDGDVCFATEGELVNLLSNKTHINFQQ